MSSDKFSAAHLYEKHGNLVDELSARDITDTGAFKMATGGGTVTGEYKFGNQFAFHNFSKFTFACNRIPDVGDTNDEAYFNRWMVIRFENTIKKAIPNFIDTLRTEDERSGLFNLAMEGLRTLLRNKRFSYYNNAEDTKREMMRSGSSLAMFASDMLIKDWSKTVTREEMYDAYVEYCQKNKLAPQTKEMLGRRLPDYTNYIADGTAEIPQIMGKPKKVRVWRNVVLRQTEEKKVEVSKVDKEFDEF
jgi:putative DNA primase/helicase